MSFIQDPYKPYLGVTMNNIVLVLVIIDHVGEPKLTIYLIFWINRQNDNSHCKFTHISERVATQTSKTMFNIIILTFLSIKLEFIDIINHVKFIFDIFNHVTFLINWGWHNNSTL